MHKATPITQKASALKQTYNPDLVAGAGKSASKFKSYRADKTEEEKPAENENDQTNPEVEIDDNTNPPNPNPADNGGPDNPNSPDGTASGKGGGDGKGTKDLLSRKDFMATQGDDISGGDRRKAWRSYQDDPLGISNPLEEE